MSLFSAIGSYEDAWKAIIMPWRQEYSLYDLGPVEFNAGDNRIKRNDFRLLNKRGQTIECSYFQQVNIDTAIPCVVYLHGNGCSRIEALHYTNIVLSRPVSFFCFDFSGCGKSEGQYTSVGWHEQEDLECVIQYLHNTGKVSKIAVWGRSMGAVTSILYANKDPRINCLIFDSPFSNFKQLVKELAKQKASIPGFIVTGAFSILRKTIISKANFDIDALRPIKYVDQIKIPALFGTAKGDDFVAPKHTKDLYMSYGGPKQLMIFEGDHNSQRPFNWMLMVQDFIKTQLLEEKDEAQNAIKSFKQLVNPAEKTAESTTTEIKTETNQTQQDQTPVKKPLLPNHQAHKNQNHMTFTWLDHSASSPNLSINKSLSQVSLSDKNVQEPVDKEVLQVERSIPSEKRLQKLFAANKKENAGAKPLQKGDENLAPKTAQINLDLSGKDLNKKETADKSPTLREHSKPVKFSQKENSGPAGERLTKKISSANASGNSNISIFGPKKKEVRSENIFGSPFRLVHEPKSDIALKEISASRMDNASNIQSNKEVAPPKTLLRAGSNPVNGSTTTSEKPILSIPISEIQNSKPKERKNLTLMPTMLPIPPRQIDSQRDTKRIFDAGAQKQKTNTTMTTRSPSKSLTIDMSALRASKENATPKQKQKTLLLQVKLNSDVPLINPSQAGPNANISYITQSLNNMSHLDSRRSSEITLRSYNSVPGDSTNRTEKLGNELRGYRDNSKLPANLLDNSTVKTSGELPPKGPQRDARNIHELVK